MSWSNFTFTCVCSLTLAAGATLIDAHGHKIGLVTSGTLAPTVNRPIAMGYLGTNHAILNHEVYAEVRGKRQPMRVTALPFVPPGYHRG